jgi:hypothetical protein
MLRPTASSGASSRPLDEIHIGGQKTRLATPGWPDDYVDRLAT